jgi:hypothetical protein
MSSDLLSRIQSSLDEYQSSSLIRRIDEAMGLEEDALGREVG